MMTDTTDTTSHVIIKLLKTLDELAFEQFGRPQQIQLRMALIRCRMSDLPEPVGEWERASGDSVCPVCNEYFGAHPMDWREIGCGDVPFLKILCNGRRVKL
jgi:hypothetical protein